MSTKNLIAVMLILLAVVCIGLVVTSMLTGDKDWATGGAVFTAFGVPALLIAHSECDE